MSKVVEFKGADETDRRTGRPLFGPSPSPLLRVNQAAKYLNIGTKTMWKLINRGEIAILQRGKNCIVTTTKDSLDEYIAKNLKRRGTI